MTDQQRPATLDFERQVRHDATVARVKAICRMKALKGSAATWWAVREMLRRRREESK